jgi:hypothetical protein
MVNICGEAVLHIPEDGDYMFYDRTLGYKNRRRQIFTTLTIGK